MKLSHVSKALSLLACYGISYNMTAATHQVDPTDDTVNNPWFWNKAIITESNTIETYNVLDETNPLPDVFPYNGKDIYVFRMYQEGDDAPKVYTYNALPEGMSKLRFKYCLGDKRFNDATLTIKIKQGKSTDDSQAVIYSIPVDHSTLYAPNQYYCVAHSFEVEYSVPQDAYIEIIVSDSGEINTYTEVIIWNLEWDDYSDGPIMPADDPDWHQGYENQLDFDAPSGQFDSVKFGDVLIGQPVQLNNSTYTFPSFDPTKGSVTMTVSDGQLVRTLDDKLVLDIPEGASLQWEGSKLEDEEFCKLQNIVVRHDVHETAAFDDGELISDSQTQWSTPSNDSEQIRPLSYAEEGRIVKLTATRPVRVYGVAVSEPKVVTTAPFIIADDAEESVRYFDIRGIEISHPQPGNLYIRVGSAGTSVIINR